MSPLGRMHPLLLHLPIGFVVLLVLFSFLKNEIETMSILEKGGKCTFTQNQNKLGTNIDGKNTLNDTIKISIPYKAPNDKVSVIKISLKGDRIIL